MRPLGIAISSVMMMTGCSSSTTPGGGSPVGPSGPGRFTHSAVQRSVAPWDGPATQLYLAEHPVAGKTAEPPYVSVYICQAPTGLSRQRVRLAGDDLKTGSVSWVPAGGESVVLRRAEVWFDEVREDRPVTGTYDLDLPDGTRERGRFEASWLPPLGPGG